MKLKNKITFLMSTVLTIALCLAPMNAFAQVYKGIDIYEYDNISDWNQVKNDGISVVIQKATEGLSHNDSLLNYRYPRIMQTGLKIGYYHFADNTGNPVGEAQHFLSQINNLHSDTVLWLDIENESNWTKGQAINYTNQFINYVQSQGYKIGLYTGLSFYYEYLSGNIPNVPLWLASYGKQPSQFPNVVSWQYSESGRVSGVIGDVDLDYFNDSIFTGQAPNGGITVQPNIDNSVLTIQRQLNHVMNAGLVEDGINGDATRNAILAFQSKYNLQCDATWGQQCVNKINELYNNKTITSNVTNINNGSSTTRIIQQQLNTVLYSSHLTVDGIQGQATTEQIKVFQTICNLKVDGIWEQQCVDAIQQIYNKSLCGRPYVNRIPTRVIQYNMGINFDGIYGQDTANHVQAWQRANGLNPDGLFGNQSWNKLLK